MNQVKMLKAKTINAATSDNAAQLRFAVAILRQSALGLWLR